MFKKMLCSLIKINPSLKKMTCKMPQGWQPSQFEKLVFFCANRGNKWIKGWVQKLNKKYEKMDDPKIKIKKKHDIYTIYIHNSHHFGQSSSSLPPFSKWLPILVSLGLEPCTHQDTLHWMHPREHLPHTNLMEKPTCESRISMCQWRLQKDSLVIKTQVDTSPPKN